MKHSLRAAVVVALFFAPLVFASAGRTTAATRGIEAAQAGTTTPAATQAAKATPDNGDTIVYMTKSGKKYHSDGCRYLSKSRIPIKLKDAVARGFSACSICKPPTLQSEPAGAKAAISSSQAAAASPKDNGDTIVYVTRTGKKYHNAGCRSLARSSIPIRLRDAIARGYGACSLCNPPTLRTPR